MSDRAGVGYLVSCTNTDGVVTAIREFAAGRRPAVSTHAIHKSKKEHATYTIIIPKRRRRKSKKRSPTNQEDIYIVFATNRPGINANRHAERWMIESQRVRTRSKTVAAKLLCFLYSMLVYNVWVMANAASTGNRAYPRVTRMDLLLNALVDLLPWEIIPGIPPAARAGARATATRHLPAPYPADYPEDIPHCPCPLVDSRPAGPAGGTGNHGISHTPCCSTDGHRRYCALPCPSWTDAPRHSRVLWDVPGSGLWPD